VNRRALVFLGVGVVVVVALNRLTRAAIARMVSASILEKLGPDPSDSLIKAAQDAGECFARELTVSDLVTMGLRGSGGDS